jgi:hypothetical protein
MKDDFMNEEMNQLENGLLAVDRLNSWQRYKSNEMFGRSLLQSVLRPVIYWVKRAAILSAHHAGLKCEFTRLRVDKECRSCCGTSMFQHPSGEEVKCNRCEDGIAHLLFIGSTIHAESEVIKWHTPRQDWWSSSLDHYLGLEPGLSECTDWRQFNPSEGWTVNKPGKPLTDEAVRSAFFLMYDCWAKDVHFILEYHRYVKSVRAGAGISEVKDWLEDHIRQSREREREHNLRNTVAHVAELPAATLFSREPAMNHSVNSV